MRHFLFGAALTVFFACGGSTTDTTDGGADAAPKPKDAGHPDAPGQPPPPPGDGGTPTTQTMTFALHTLFLGESDRNGVPSALAWKDFGFNLDGLVTTKSSTDVCTLYAGSPSTNQTDGTNGTDNAWGSILLPIFEAASIDQTPSTTATGSIDNGDWTVQIEVTGLSNDPNQTASGLTAQIFSSGAYGTGKPAFDQTTDWPVLSTSVNDGKSVDSGAIAVFKNAYISNGTFVSGPGPDPLVLNMNIAGVPFTFQLHDAMITFDHKSNLATQGTIAGTLDTQELTTAMKAVAGQISTSLCGNGFDGIATQIDMASDILDDGSNQAGTPCTAISVGLGFEAQLVANPTEVALPPVPPPNPCN